MPFLGLVEPAISDLEVAVRVASAAGLGGLIGLEREAAHQPAGLRTHIAVALGAALFGLISVHGFDAYAQPRADSNYQIDVTRVASQVVVGIGFLGGGTIIKHGASVRGLTTAASLWVTAAVGLAAGVGSFVAAGITTGALLLSLVGLRAPREWVRRRGSRGRATVAVHLAKNTDPSGVIQALYGLEGVVIKDLTVSRREEDGLVVDADLVGPANVDLAGLLAEITARDDVVEVEID
ncbi:MAG: MgtC/SapB family protein [Acidimicrobiales bacterium]